MTAQLSTLPTHHSFVTLGVAAGSLLLLPLALTPTSNSSGPLRILRTLRVPRPQPLPPPLVRHFLGRFLKWQQARERRRCGLLGQLSRSGVVRTRPVDRAHFQLKTRHLADPSRLSQTHVIVANKLDVETHNSITGTDSSLG